MLELFMIVCILSFFGSAASCAANKVADNRVNQYCERHFDKIQDVKSCVKEIREGK
jgi:hypothetical protein